MANTLIKKLEEFEKEIVTKGIEKKGRIITVSGLAGSGKSSVVRLLQKNLPGFKIIHAGGLFREAAEKKGISLEKYCETRTEQDDIDTEKQMLEQGLPGNIIVDGWIAGWCLGKWADLRIFVDCPVEIRAQRLAKRESLSFDEAFGRAERRYNSDTSRYKKLYGIDMTDMSIYNFVIDNSGDFDALKEKVLRDIAKGFAGNSN